MELAKNVKTHGKKREERMDKEATCVDIDAIDTDMHARAGDAELIPWLPECAPQLSFFARHRGRVQSCWWCAPVYDTDCLQPLKQTHGCSLWSSGQLLAPLVPLIPRHQLACPRCRCCGLLSVAPSRAPLARCRWLRPRHLVREAPRLCLVETVLPSPEGVLLLRETHAAPPRSNR